MDYEGGRAQMYCRRCDDVVTAVVPWVGWKRIRLAWWGFVLLLAALSPFIGADYCVMIPSAFAFVFAGGTLHRLATEQPFCSQCSLPLDPGRAAGTGVHARPAQRT